MNRVNRCVPDAWVTGASRALPSDPTEFDWPQRTPKVGCTQLVCLVCKEHVKHRDGLYLPNQDSENHLLVPERAKQLFERDDWASVDGVSRKQDFRLYACRCFYRSEFEALITFNPEHEDLAGNASRNLPWTCEGHPALELPVELGAQSLTDSSQLAAAIVQAAKDPAQMDVLRGFYYRSQNGSLETIVPEALNAAAAGPGPIEPGLKALFAAQTNLAPLKSLFEELVRYQTKLAIADPTRREQIVDILSATVAQRPAGIAETGTMDMLRDEALQGVVTAAQLELFETYDREWFIAHLEELVTKTAAHAGGVVVRGGRALLLSGVDAGQVEQTVAALARKTGMAVDALVAQAQADVGIAWYLDNTKQVVEMVKRSS